MAIKIFLQRKTKLIPTFRTENQLNSIMKRILSIFFAMAMCVFMVNAADADEQIAAEEVLVDDWASMPDLPVLTQTLASNVDKHPLAMAVIEPVGIPKAIVVFSHGMAEHKERYYPFMQYLAKHGYVCEINDHRGHGGSITEKAGLGDFGTNKVRAISDDIQQMVEYMQDKYPGIPTYFFGHSMGTMVGRMYLQDYDASIDKAVLCGAPSASNTSLKGSFKILWRNFWAPHKVHSSKTFEAFDKGGPKNNWLSVNEENVKAYNADPLCGYPFTNNGQYHLNRMSKQIAKDNWGIHNPDLPIFFIAGEDDPAIGNPEVWANLIKFVESQGYNTVSRKLYPGLRHELLLEINKEQIWADVMAFFDE